MSFDILYVEDDHLDWKNLSESIKESKSHRTQLVLKWVSDPRELERKLSLSTRLILADVYFPSTSDPKSKKIDKLDQIITIVEEWNEKQGRGRPVPIIAYTSRGKKALENCLRRRKHLYDIWDKSSASPEYAAWRLFELSKELSRFQPDARTQQLIQQMKVGASWHKHVVEMTKKYDAGWTEYDQIERAGASIKDIAFHLGVWGQCEPLWQAMIDWEPLSRAVSRKTRGHARHVINVFWLGYFLLHHRHLSPLFTKYWETLKLTRGRMSAVDSDGALEALANCWFFAGLFHDVGGAVEQSSSVTTYLKTLLSPFGDLGPIVKGVEKPSATGFMERAQEWLEEFDPSLRAIISQGFEDSISQGKPDQGVVGAVHLRNVISEGKQHCYAREGGRAMSLHNMLPKLGGTAEPLPISWQSEPLVCLLLLCDQLQTWDRETGSHALTDGDQPTRAELSDLAVEMKDGRPEIMIAIDYIAPAHLDHSFELYTRVKEKLSEVLRKNPYSALNRIQKPWPFAVIVKCTLSGDSVGTDMKFGFD
jgi:hypothetical protein